VKISVSEVRLSCLSARRDEEESPGQIATLKRDYTPPRKAKQDNAAVRRNAAIGCERHASRQNIHVQRVYLNGVG